MVELSLAQNLKFRGRQGSPEYELRPTLILKPYSRPISYLLSISAAVKNLDSVFHSDSKTTLCQFPDSPKVEHLPIPDSPKVEHLPIPDSPKVEHLPIPDSPKIEHLPNGLSLIPVKEEISVAVDKVQLTKTLFDQPPGLLTEGVIGKKPCYVCQQGVKCVDPAGEVRENLLKVRLSNANDSFNPSDFGQLLVGGDYCYGCVIGITQDHKSAFITGGLNALVRNRDLTLLEPEEEEHPFDRIKREVIAVLREKVRQQLMDSFNLEEYLTRCNNHGIWPEPATIFDYIAENTKNDEANRAEFDTIINNAFAMTSVENYGSELTFSALWKSAKECSSARIEEHSQ